MSKICYANFLIKVKFCDFRIWDAVAKCSKTLSLYQNLTNLNVTPSEGTTFMQSSISTLVSPNFVQLRYVNIVEKSIERFT